VDFLFANDFEVEKTTGIALRQGDSIYPAAVEQTARQLLDAGVRSWVVIHFPEAVYACGVHGTASGSQACAFRQPGLPGPPGR